MKKLALVVAAGILLVPMASIAGPMTAGKWQVTMQMDMPGMPMKMPPVTFTHCVTKEQAEKPEPPKSNRKETDCKVTDYSLKGNTVTWKVSCEKEKMTGEGSITYSGDSYEGTMHMKMPDHEMSQKYSGKRLGDCDEKN